MENTQEIYYYYFVGNRILKTIREVNLDLNKSYIPFTNEQIEFITQYPNASFYEVKNCRLNEEYQPTIEEIRESAISYIDRMSRDTIGKKVDVLGFCNAVSGTIYAHNKQSSVYDDEEILKTADDFLRIGKTCRNKYKETKLLIENSDDEEYINNVVENTKQFFESIVLPVDDLEYHKRLKIREIDVYDISENVNGFFLGDNLLWLDKDTRTGLVNTLNSAVIIGREQINIWFSGLYITLHIEEARQMLAALEIYATDCYNVTAQHKVQVNNLQTIEEVDNFDVTIDYPQRLVFNLQK